MCAGNYNGLVIQVLVEGLKCCSSIHFIKLIRLPRSSLTDYEGRLADNKLNKLDAALAAAIGINESLNLPHLVLVILPGLRERKHLECPSI
jgi:hypothetical protein